MPSRQTRAAARNDNLRSLVLIPVPLLRNSEGATAIAAYVIRARKNAPVSTPIEWRELDHDFRFDHCNVKTVPARLHKMQRDPWREFDAQRTRVTAAHFKQVGAMSGGGGQGA